ncbi:HalOD1 output domain-containing protein [Halobium palmae]|uniref:HalOD1 output domain-containing protein n=1 Tax=Halobium palmae TaxID=1776492 RepID=A0ABD5RW06_9EURY
MAGSGSTREEGVMGGDGSGGIERETLAVEISAEVADELGCEPADLPEKLYHAVDVEAVEEAFSGAIVDGEISFVYCGCLVTVAHDGSITVSRTLGY